MSLPPPPFLISEKFALTTSTHGTPLVATLKKYVRSLETLDRKAPAVILLFAHGAGFRESHVIYLRTVGQLNAL